MGLNLYNDIQNNLNESVGDFQNTSLSQPMSIINDSDNNDLSYEDIALDNIYVDDNGMTSEEIIKNNIDLMAEDCAKQLVGDLMDDITPETESLYNANLDSYEKEFKDYILNNIDTLVSSHNSQQSNLDNILGEAVESELKLSGKVSEILQQIQGKNYTGFEKVLNALNPNADVVVMYNTENKFLHIEIPNLAVLWDGKEPQ